jgi:hypothetical protein
VNSPSLESTPRLRGERSADISDGNGDGNDCSRQHPDAAADSRVLSHIPPELGIRYTLKAEAQAAPPRQSDREPYSSRVQQPHSLRATPSDHHRSVNCPWFGEVASAEPSRFAPPQGCRTSRYVWEAGMGDKVQVGAAVEAWAA